MTGAGLFITFEGGEGSGKSTQIRLLKEYLEQSGHGVILTREPGGTPEAEKIRDLLVQRDGGAWSAEEECLLLYAARKGHVERVIKPAIAAGKIVLCDRFSDSTMAYQGYGHGLSHAFIDNLDRLVLGGFKPDMTFMLDIAPEVGLARSERRLVSAADGSKEQTEDRFERLDFSFHKKLRRGYAELAANDQARCVVLNADMKPEELAEIIRDKVQEKLKA